MTARRTIHDDVMVVTARPTSVRDGAGGGAGVATTLHHARSLEENARTD
jgi:hypothetical protein